VDGLMREIRYAAIFGEPDLGSIGDGSVDVWGGGGAGGDKRAGCVRAPGAAGGEGRSYGGAAL